MSNDEETISSGPLDTNPITSQDSCVGHGDNHPVEFTPMPSDHHASSPTWAKGSSKASGFHQREPRTGYHKRDAPLHNRRFVFMPCKQHHMFVQGIEPLRNEGSCRSLIDTDVVEGKCKDIVCILPHSSHNDSPIHPSIHPFILIQQQS
jgi:hypothetical protein